MADIAVLQTEQVLVNWALATVCRGPEIAFSVDRTYQVEFHVVSGVSAT